MIQPFERSSGHNHLFDAKDRRGIFTFYFVIRLTAVICRRGRLPARYDLPRLPYIRSLYSPFSLLLLLFYFVLSLIEPTRTKIKSPRKAPDFPPPRVCLQICNCWKTCGNDGKIGTGARAEHVNSSTCRGVAISLLRIRITLP